MKSTPPNSFFNMQDRPTAKRAVAEGESEDISTDTRLWATVGECSLNES